MSAGVDDLRADFEGHYTLQGMLSRMFLALDVTCPDLPLAQSVWDFFGIGYCENLRWRMGTDIR